MPREQGGSETLGILYDGYEGEWEECAYVPVSEAPDPRRARRLLMREAGFILEPEFFVPTPGLTETCFMRPDDREAIEEGRFTPCNRDHPEAVEFWRCYYDERERRWLPGWPIRVWRGLLHYRHRRGIGQTRRQAFGSVRVHLRPYWFFRAKNRIRTALKGTADAP